ncbi:MAG: hypothetical protein WKF97_12680 [Chitinophagaceae bacterium]
MKKLLVLLLIFTFTIQPKAQNANCTFKQPIITINFGAGNVPDLNTAELFNYERVSSYCPTDGHYTFASYTSDCFRGDWFTLPEDHTPGDADGNMMLVNASPSSGTFLTTAIKGLKSGTTYEFGVWMMNLCRISDKCPFPLLPSITIRLQTPAGKIVAQFGIGEVARRESPHWTQYRSLFTAPPSETALILTMIDNMPGGCGNDFALDDITFRECIKQTPLVTKAPKSPAVAKQKSLPPVVAEQKPAPSKPLPKKITPAPVKRQTPISPIAKPQADLPVRTAPAITHKAPVFRAPPPALTTRSNPLIKQIETEAGDINVDLYDNGEIDGDTVSIYHNNVLLVSRVKISEKPISFRIAIDAEHPHHELIMVANNLGSIPPNTSLMVIKAGTKRYEVFISSTEQKNAKVVFDLKE